MFSITKIQILNNPYGMDSIFLHTDLPCGNDTFTFPQYLSFTVSHGTAINYIEKNFRGLPVETIKSMEDILSGIL